MSNYYELLDIDPLWLANKKEADIKEEINKKFREAARLHHPDKEGDEEIFKEMVNARDVLSDALRRLRYNAVIKDQVDTELYEPRSRPMDVPDQNEQSKTFHALVDLDILRAEFKEFYQARLAAGAIASEHGYTSRLTQDPKTGNDILTLTFPDQNAADSFIKMALAKGMIKDADILKEEQAAAAYRPDPFRRALTY